MISITFDLEWAPDSVLRDTLNLLNSYNIEATFFSTHDDGLTCPTHERAIHPNFNKNDDFDSVLDELCSIYPDATGLRSHQMFISTKLRNKFVSRGIEYESNYMAYKVENLVPFWMPEGTVQFPVYWMDDIWFRRDSIRPDISKLLESPGLKVFDFHPPHITFNTPSTEYYTSHKDEYWSKKPDIDELRYQGYGVRSVFINFLEYIVNQGIETYTLNQLHTIYLNENRSDWPDRDPVQ